MSVLKIKDLQDNWIPLSTMRGRQGNGIANCTLNNDYTLTITFTDGNSYTTPIIRGEKGEKGDKGNTGNSGGPPTPISTASEMTNIDQIYLYTGSETGYTFGNWYYYNGSTWVSGGTYGAGIQIDSTLSQSGEAADAKETGRKINGLTSDISVLPYYRYAGEIAETGNGFVSNAGIITANSNYKYAKYSLHVGTQKITVDSMYVTGTASNYAAFAFFDSDDVLISTVNNKTINNTNTGNTFTNVEVDVPLNVDYVLITFGNMSSSTTFSTITEIGLYKPETNKRVFNNGLNNSNKQFFYFHTTAFELGEYTSLAFNAKFKTESPVLSYEVYFTGYDADYTNRTFAIYKTGLTKGINGNEVTIAENFQNTANQLTSKTYIGVVVNFLYAYSSESGARTGISNANLYAITSDYCLLNNTELKLAHYPASGFITLSTEYAEHYNPLYGGFLCAIGDSLTGVYYKAESETWVALIAKWNNMQYENLGVSGNPIAKPDGYTNKCMAERVDDLSATKFYSHIFVMGGANDYNEHVPIGENTDTVITTFKGAVNHIITTLMQKFPNAHIVFATTYRRNQAYADKPYADAMMEVCKLHSIPCLNNYENSGVQFFDSNWMAIYGATNALGNNHLNAAGDLFVAPRFEHALKYGVTSDGYLIDSTPTQGSTNAVSSGGVYDALAGKVAKPLTSSNGTNGQLLRTLGNGQTEWTDFATPTTEQVGEAVENWLDEHPEATTTVQDGSLTADKFVKGSLGFVTPEMFGAVGDGSTDDTQALKDCIDYAMANGFEVRLSAKTYIISPSVLSFEITDGQSIIITGQGQNTVVKLKDAGLDGKWSQLFTIIISPVSSKAHDVIFSNFCIDGNRRNQGDIASDSYAYEASQMISIRGGSTGTLENGMYLDRFIVEDMRFYDPVADCVNISGSAQVGIRDVFLHRIVSTDRQGTRNDIGITGNPLHLVHISDCDCDTIHFEYNSEPTDDLIIPYTISNCRFGVCSLAANINLFMTGCVISDDFLLAGMRTAMVANCDIRFVGGHYNVREANSKGDFIFDNCVFRAGTHADGNNQVLDSFQIWFSKICTIKNSEFLYVGDLLDLDLDNDTVGDHISGAAISVVQSVRDPVIIDGCTFDKRYQFVVLHRHNNITLRNMEINTAMVCDYGTPAISSSDTVYAKMRLENIRLGEDCKNSIKLANVPNGTLSKANGEIRALPSNFCFIENTGSYMEKWIANVIGDLHRSVDVTDPLSYATIAPIASWTGYQSRKFFYLLKGDEFIYKGANPERYPEKWVVIDTAKTIYKSDGTVYEGTALEERIMSVGSGVGATTDRPTCYLSKGFEFFDITLGKPIFWDGTGWVDSTGATV